MAQTNWQNLPNTSTPINAYNLNKLERYQKYSETEAECGTWIDGKPIYRKVITHTPSSTVGTTGAMTNYDIAHNISDLKYVTKCDCNMFRTNGGTNMVPNMVAPNSTTNVAGGIVVNQVDDTNIRLRIINDTWDTNRTFVIILEYTKTTD